MRLIYIVAISFLVLILINACTQGTTQEEIVCNPPYIQVGTSCCLDGNNNQICDTDEKPIEKDAKDIEKLTREDLMFEVEKIINFHQPEIEGTFTKGRDYKDKCGHSLFINFVDTEKYGVCTQYAYPEDWNQGLRVEIVEFEAPVPSFEDYFSGWSKRPNVEELIFSDGKIGRELLINNEEVYSKIFRFLCQNKFWVIIDADTPGGFDEANSLAITKDILTFCNNEDVQYPPRPEKIVNTVENKEFCGNNICEKSDGIYCLDCPIECKSDYCNEKLSVYCEDCDSGDDKLIQGVYESQEEIYDCLSDFYNFKLPRPIYYKIEKKDYVNYGPVTNRIGVIFKGFHGNNIVENPEDLIPDIHETIHVFNYYYMGPIIFWFDEAIMLQLSTKLKCSDKQQVETRMDEYNAPQTYYENIINGIPMEVNLLSNHDIGATFLLYLEHEYGCDESCLMDVLGELHKLNTAKPNKSDLKVYTTTNAIIKREFEKRLGVDLTFLFDVLQIKY